MAVCQMPGMYILLVLCWFQHFYSNIRDFILGDIIKYKITVEHVSVPGTFQKTVYIFFISKIASSFQGEFQSVLHTLKSLFFFFTFLF